jgi:hypothetical protein
MDYSDDGWKPVDGKYDVELTDIKTGVKAKEGVNFAWVKPSFRIISPGEFEGKAFQDFMYVEPQPKELSPALKQLLRLGTCVAGRELRNAVEAIQIITDAKGEFLTLEVFTTTAKKGKNVGKEYKNIRYLAKLESTVTS